MTRLNRSRKKKRGSGPTSKRRSALSHKSGTKHRVSHRSRRASRQQQETNVRCLAAVNRVRRGQSPSLSSAARAERTTLRAIRKGVPDALIQDRPGGRIRVKKSDGYSAKVEVMTTEGARVVTARGSHQRELAGRHRATFLRVLQGKEPPSALEQFRGKKIGGHELIGDYELLRSFAQAGDVGQLESLYVSPDVSV